MTVFFLTLCVLLVTMAGLAVGLLMGRPGIQSSCGGNALMKLCPACESLEVR